MSATISFKATALYYSGGKEQCIKCKISLRTKNKTNKQITTGSKGGTKRFIGSFEIQSILLHDHDTIMIQYTKRIVPSMKSKLGYLIIQPPDFRFIYLELHACLPRTIQ